MPVDDLFDRVEAAAAAVRARVPEFPDVAVVLGSGLGAFTARLGRPVSIEYGELPHWPPVSVPGHEGRLVVGLSAGRPVAVLSGRRHLYEGDDPRLVTFGVRVLGALGVKTLVLTNAAGGINTSYPRGALMVISDHLNLMGVNPLIGPNDDRFGPRFPDLTEAWSRRLRKLATAAGRDAGFVLPHGVYAAVPGPNYETPAEIRALRMLGADAVGMSTVPEALVARHMGIELLGLSCIANTAAGVSLQPLRHEDVVETAGRTAGHLAVVLERVFARLGEEGAAGADGAVDPRANAAPGTDAPR
jgi:purine-nucleoside phosphorylase